MSNNQSAGGSVPWCRAWSPSPGVRQLVDRVLALPFIATWLCTDAFFSLNLASSDVCRAALTSRDLCGV